MGKQSKKSSQQPNKKEGKNKKTHEDEALKELKSDSQVNIPRQAGKIKKQNKHNQTKVQIEENDMLDTKNIFASIEQKISQLKSICHDLDKLGMEAEETSPYHQKRMKLSYAGQKAGINAMKGYIASAQDDLYAMQKWIFKSINNLEVHYSNIKDILEDTKALNDVEIDNVLNIVTSKITALKQKITELDQIVEKGNKVFNKSKE